MSVHLRDLSHWLFKLPGHVPSRLWILTSISDTIASEDLHVTVSDGRGAPSTRARAIQIILLTELSLGYASWGPRWWAQMDIVHLQAAIKYDRYFQ